MIQKILRAGLLIVLVALPTSHPAAAYSLLTHEQLVDLTWQSSIVPLLLSRYPGLTPAQLEEARAYAYGGCVIQDMGYYPFGDIAFSDLTHYVRSGDFVVNLFRDAQNADELAFAIGALSHYVGDTIGHSEATNRAVPVEFPNLLTRYGPVVSYAEGEHQHVQAEFAFDIAEIAQHHMAPVHFLRHIGLKVPTQQLALAYYQTYGLKGEFSGRHRRFNVREYRFAVHTFIPRIAYAVTLLHRRHEPPEPTTADAAELDKMVAAVAAENDWQRYRRNPGIGTYTLAGLLFVLPKIGPLKVVAVKGPTEATQADYLHSVVVSTSILQQMLRRFTPPAATNSEPAGAALPQQPPHEGRAGADPAGSGPALATVAVATDPAAASDPASLADQAGGESVSSSPQAHQAGNLAVTQTLNADALLASKDPRHPLPNRDLDTGKVVQPGGYPLTDSTYAALLHRLTRTPATPIPPGIKRDIQAYYADPNAPIGTKKDPAKWAQVQADLVTLGSMPTSAEPDPYPTYGGNAE
jgi:hypothetical protein